MKIPHVLILDRMNSIDNHAWSLPYLFQIWSWSGGNSWRYNVHWLQIWKNAKN